MGRGKSRIELSDEEFHGTVITSTRRNATVMLADDSLVRCSLVGKIDRVLVGDKVQGKFVKESSSKSKQNTKLVRTGVISLSNERDNCLHRTNEFRTKELCANIDLLCIVTAGGSLTNYLFIDTLVVAALYNQIDFLLVVNKCDLDNITELVSLYESLDVPIRVVSAKHGIGIKELETVLFDEKNSLITFTGVSGVGKSSLINRLVPEAKQTVSELSVKTGQGQQTTSQAYAFPFYPKSRDRILLVDTPGVQNFGLGEIVPLDLKNHFSEIRSIGTECRYRDCSHIEEEECAVIEAVKSGEIAFSRYNSYVNIMHSLESIKKY